MTFADTYANPTGRTARGPFIGALLTLVAVAAFYFMLVKGRNGEWCLVTLLFPGFMLHARRLHDMGQTAWLLLAPLALSLAAAWLHLMNPGTSYEHPVTIAAIVLCAAFVLWGLVGKGQAEANRFGEPATT